jgi:sporulation protein YlmC with PRC-barrel domain
MPAGTGRPVNAGTFVKVAPFLVRYHAQEMQMSDIGPANTTDGTLAVNETDRLIASDKVEGTSVYDRNSKHIGAIYNVMIDKYSGQVAYAVISFGGFLGIGTRYHPIPWKKLTYDRGLGGYVADVSNEQLERAPVYASDASPWGDPSYGRSVYDYYDVPYYM